MTNDGLLIIDKPADWTSNDVVQKVKRLLGAQRVGHTGTLDPDATGVLVLCLNRATKWSEQLKDHNKVYRARITLGRSTDTGDASGHTVSEATVGEIALADVEEVLGRFRGTIDQQVPRYAAVKVKGKALYRWAREKKDVQRPWRRVEIHSLVLESCTRDGLSLEVACSKGTYIRALAEDIGQALGYPAHLETLRRTAVGPFDLTSAIRLDQLIEDVATGRFDVAEHLRGREEALSDNLRAKMPDKVFT